MQLRHDGPDYKAFRRREVQEAEVAAEAQRAWEEKARADAAAWRTRVEGEADGASAPPVAQPQPQ